MRRWKLLISEYDFDIEYLKGEDNIVADGQSRLIRRHDDAFKSNDIICSVMESEDGCVCWVHERDQRVTSLGTRWGRRVPPSNAHPAIGRTVAWDVSPLLAALVEIESPVIRVSQEELNALEEFKIPNDKYRIISQHHNSRVGHFGLEKTLEKLAQRPCRANNHRPRPIPWLYMREHVKRFIRTCPCCQKMSQLRIPIHTKGFTAASYEPMSLLSIDTIGPLTEDEDGNAYIAYSYHRLFHALGGAICQPCS